MSETMDTTNILVCDDDKEIAGAIEIYLRNEGYHVFKAYNGVEALRIAREQPLQLIIMDIMMPQMDGVQATMKIREEKNIPIARIIIPAIYCICFFIVFPFLRLKIQIKPADVIRFILTP